MVGLGDDRKRYLVTIETLQMRWGSLELLFVFLSVLEDLLVLRRQKISSVLVDIELLDIIELK